MPKRRLFLIRPMDRLTRLSTPHLSSQQHRAGSGSKKLHDAFGDQELRVVAEEVEEGAGVDDVDLAVQEADFRTGVEDVGCDELGLQRVLVAEEFVPQLEELRAEIGAPEVLFRGAV